MTAAEEARRTEDPFLLHVDETNRADPVNVLGEAVFLIEPDADDDRSVTLSHGYGAPFGTARYPTTATSRAMNTSDCSIAILDVAIRRRFAPLKLLPQLQVVRENTCGLMEEKFREFQRVFVEHATDDAFNLMPGHSYFLKENESRARRKLIRTCDSPPFRVAGHRANARYDRLAGGPRSAQDSKAPPVGSTDSTLGALERGLAGLGDLSGIPWRMSMAEFFESWVESIARKVVTQIRGKVRVARRSETTTPIRWDPPYLGSQNSLQPDVVIDQRDRTIVLDAKYKAHWEEIDQRGWRNVRDDLRSRHRKDLLQALAYGNLPSTNDVTVCLLYPCRPETWASLKERGRTAHVADISSGQRQLSLVLGAVPMAERVTDVAEHVAEWLPPS